MTGTSINFRLTGALLALAFLVGGAGVSFPLLQLLLGGAAVLVAAYFVVSAGRTGEGPLDRWAMLLLGLTLLLPLLQLIPLPAAAWHLLPGRDVPKAVDAVLGWAVWRPWTLDVEATIRSWLVLIPSAVVFAGCLRISAQERVRLLWLVVGFALLNALLGIFQLATGGGATPYPSTHSGDPIGFFVNRNHSAAIMLAAMPIAAALGSARARRAQGRTSILIAATTIVAILTILVIGSTSRAGLLLLPVSLLVSLFILFRRQSREWHALPALLAVAALGLILVTSRGFDRVLNRFAGANDPRFLYWADVQYALQHYGLAGTGVGTFVPVFQTAESLEGVIPQVINHAHNDYLEILLGAGIPGALLFSGFLVLFAVAIHRGSASRQPEIATLRFATATAIALLLGYSLVDYPLRMPAVAAAFAVCCAVLLPTRRSSSPASGRDLSINSSPAKGTKAWRRVKRPAGLGLLALVLVVMVQASLSARAIAEERFGDASNWAIWSSKAIESQATVDLARNDRREAWRRASTVLRLSPISAPAIRNLALVRLSEGKPDGHKLMQIAVALGWRDPITQLWAIEAAQLSGEQVMAVQRAEALFRQRIFMVPALRLLLGAQDFEPMARLLAGRIAQRPDWRKDLIYAAGTLPASDLNRLQILISRLNMSSAPATTDEMKPLLGKLISDGRSVEAQRLWLLLNPAYIDNGDFNAFWAAEGGLSPPTGWEVPRQNRQATTVVMHDAKLGDRGLRIGRTSWVRILAQDTMLPAGSYTFSYQAREAGPAPVALRWQMRCSGSAKTQVAEARLAPRQRWRRYTAVFDVPPRDCLVQRLALRRVESSNQSETWLDRISFKPHER